MFVCFSYILLDKNASQVKFLLRFQYFCIGILHQNQYVKKQNWQNMNFRVCK